MITDCRLRITDLGQGIIPYSYFKLIVYSVGFGSGAELSTLQSIASYGNGDYFYSNVTELDYYDYY